MRVRTVAVALTFACALSSNAFAAPLTYATPGVVGTRDGQVPSNIPNEIALAQAILDFVGLGVVSAPYKTSTYFDYASTLSGGVKDQSGNLVVPSGVNYVLAKYDGPNAGYVLYYLPDFGSNTLPNTPANFWTTGTPTYGLSHFTMFESTSVPDGGSTAALLGSVLFAVGLLRRRFSQN